MFIYRIFMLTKFFILISYSQSQDCGSLNGFNLPCWRDFLEESEGLESFPYYPYAKRENGCSIPKTKPGTYDSFRIAGYEFSFSEACNEHDKCYYTLNKTATECNLKFLDDLKDSCNKSLSTISGWKDIASKRFVAISSCYSQAYLAFALTYSAQSYFFPIAQNNQKKYMDRVKLWIERAERGKTFYQDNHWIRGIYANIDYIPPGTIYVWPSSDGTIDYWCDFDRMNPRYKIKKVWVDTPLRFMASIEDIKRTARYWNGLCMGHILKGNERHLF